MSIDRRLVALLENNLLKIATLLDPRYAFNETIFTKAYWQLIEEQLILYAEKGTFLTEFKYVCFFIFIF
jgi:hypothetical protein